MNDDICLSKLNSLSHATKFGCKNIPKDDLKILDYIFKKDNDFNIAEYLNINLDIFYSLAAIIDAKDFNDLVFIISILRTHYFSFELMMKLLKDKKHFLFTNKDELLTYLLGKEICLESSKRIIDDLGHLHEWEILLLESSDMSKEEILWIKNVKSLSDYDSSFKEANYIYSFVFFKYYYPSEFNKVNKL